MAKIYLEKLFQLLSDLNIKNEVDLDLETKHFFSGAALYANKVLCASWSPGRLAFKLSESEVAKLLSDGKAKPLKYFKKGYIKKGYAMFENTESMKKSMLKRYFLKAINQTSK